MGIFSLFIESCLIRIASFMYAVNMGAFKSQVELNLSQDLQTICHVTTDYVISMKYSHIFYVSLRLAVNKQ